jgi:hypothetical protein
VRRLVPRDKAKGYRLVQRRLDKVREAREVPYEWITDNFRIVRGYDRYGSPGDYPRLQRGSTPRLPGRGPRRGGGWLEENFLAAVISPAVVEECGPDLY